MSRHKWLHLKLKAPSPVLEALMEALLDRGALGAWQQGDQSHLYFPDEFNPLEIHSSLRSLAGYLGIKPEQIEFSFSWQEEENWQAGWKRYFRPTRVGRRILVKAPWHELSREQASTRTIIEIEPGMAFGTGTHPSTQLTLEALEELATPDAATLDVGTGSGILAIAAAKFGCRPVVACDVDPVAVRNAKANLTRNQATNRVSLFVGSVDSLTKLPVWDLVLANIQRQVLLRLLPDLSALLRPRGRLVLAGLIETEYDEMTSEMAKHGLSPTQCLRRDEWIAIVARKD